MLEKTSELLKDNPETKCFEVKIAVTDSNFYGIPIKQNGKMISINHQQLLSRFFNNMKRRLLTTKIIKESSTAAGSSLHRAEYNFPLSEKS